MGRAKASYWQKKFGADWRGDKDDHPQIRETRELDQYFCGTTDELIASVKTLAEGLTEAKWQFEIDWSSYGDRDRDVLQVSGWRDATGPEIMNKELELEGFKVRQKAALDSAEAMLRKSRPELFK